MFYVFIKGIRRIPENDLTHLQATPAECNTLDGNCLRLSMDLGRELKILVDDDHEIPCDEIFCDDGYEVVEKPEGCKCKPVRRKISRSFELADINSGLMPPATTQSPLSLRLIDENAKKYLIWLYEFQQRRQSFADNVLGQK